MTEPDKAIRTKAVVTVTLEVQVESAWGSTWTVAQIHREASDAARIRIASLLGKEPNIKRVGDLKVALITHDIT